MTITYKEMIRAAWESGGRFMGDCAPLRDDIPYNPELGSCVIMPNLFAFEKLLEPGERRTRRYSLGALTPGVLTSYARCESLSLDKYLAVWDSAPEAARRGRRPIVRPRQSWLDAAPEAVWVLRASTADSAAWGPGLRDYDLQMVAARMGSNGRAVLSAPVHVYYGPRDNFDQFESSPIPVGDVFISARNIPATMPRWRSDWKLRAAIMRAVAGEAPAGSRLTLAATLRPPGAKLAAAIRRELALASLGAM